MSTMSRAVGVGILIVIVGFFVFKSSAENTASNTSDANNQNTTTATQVEEPASTIDTAKLDGIQAIIDSYASLDISVSVTDLQTSERYHYGDDASFTAASIGKLVTAGAYLRMVESRQASLADQVGSFSGSVQLQKMIVESDNDAWHDLKEIVTVARQQDYAESIGLRGYSATDNTITTDDVALLLQKLANGHLLNNEHTQTLLSYMKDANYRGFIVAAIPPDVTAYHKVGLLEDRVHDAAIIKKGDRSYVLVIFSKSAGAYSFSKGATLFGEITDKTLTTFFDAN